MAARGVRLKRRVRQLPGASIAQARLPNLLRRNRAFRALVRRVYAIDGSTRVPVDVAAGRVLDGVGTENLPVVLVVVLGAERPTIDRTVDDVARLQLMTAAFRPVFVIDTPAFASMRKYGFPAEVLIPASQWSDAEYTWEEYARRLLALMLDGYSATASVTVGPQGLDTAARVLLGSLHPGARSPGPSARIQTGGSRSR